MIGRIRKTGYSALATLLLASCLFQAVPVFSAADGSVPDNLYAYSEYEKMHLDNNVPFYSGEPVPVAAEGYAQASSAEGVRSLAEEEGITWSSATDWIEWELDAPEDALYSLKISYYTSNPSGIQAARTLSVNGEVPFKEASYIPFKIFWKDRSGKVVLNKAGDEIWPSQDKIRDAAVSVISDPEGLSGKPLLFRLHKGVNTIRLFYLEQQLDLYEIAIESAEAVMPYDLYLQSHAEMADAGISLPVKFEAERSIASKNDGSIRIYADSDPATTPYVYGYRRINAVGGPTWSRPGQTVSVSLDVPEDGFYKITMRVYNAWGERLPVFRDILIDGRLPFAEAADYGFSYDREWQTVSLTDSNGVPYRFALSKGSHIVSMTARTGVLSGIVKRLEEYSLSVSDIILRLTMITGVTPDSNYDYDIGERIPTFSSEVSILRDDIASQADLIANLGEGGESIITSLRQMV
ncbi:MAG: carbohydrate-binding protein, partial [Saccharofermentanales bacterium]